MTFGEALEYLKNGDMIKRRHWGGYWSLENIYGLSRPIIIATLKHTAERVPAIAYQEDILAEDWEVVTFYK